MYFLAPWQERAVQDTANLASTHPVDNRSRDAAAAPPRDSAGAALPGVIENQPGTFLEHPTHPYADTDVDGDVIVDDAGNFVPSTLTLDLFNYFFIESGRLDDVLIVQQIHDWLASRLREPALSQAKAFLAQYLAMRELTAQAYASGAMQQHPRARLALLRDLQEQAYGRELATALFDEQYQRQLQRLERMEAAARGEVADPHLGLSPAEIATYERTRAVLSSQAMSNKDISEEELWLQRSEAFGYDAAYRLAELDEKRSAWQARLDRYYLEKAALDADTSLDANERARRNEALLADHFNSTERTRVRALAKIRAGDDGT